MSNEFKKVAQEELASGINDLYRSRFAKHCAEAGLPPFRSVEELDNAAMLAKTAMDKGLYVPRQKHAALLADRQWSESDAGAIQRIATGLRKLAAVTALEGE